jgi:NAD(P)H-flavin reductase
VGLAPLKSIISFWETNCSVRKISLYYGARTIKDLYDHEIFMELNQKNNNFNYYPALSEGGSAWKDEKGFIHTVMKKYMENAKEAEAYICGPPIMINAVTNVLKEKGIIEERIWYDKF